MIDLGIDEAELDPEKARALAQFRADVMADRFAASLEASTEAITRAFRAAVDQFRGVAITMAEAIAEYMPPHPSGYNYSSAKLAWPQLADEDE